MKFSHPVLVFFFVSCFLVYCCLWWHLFTPICISSHTSHYPCPHNMCVFSAEALNSNMIIQLVIDCSAQWLVHMWLKIEIITFTLAHCNLIYNSAYIIVQFTFPLDADDDVEFHFKHLHCVCSILYMSVWLLPCQYTYSNTLNYAHTLTDGATCTYVYTNTVKRGCTVCEQQSTRRYTQTGEKTRSECLYALLCVKWTCTHQSHGSTSGSHEPALKSVSSGSTPQRSLSFPSSLQQSVTKTQSFSLMILK